MVRPQVQSGALFRDGRPFVVCITKGRWWSEHVAWLLDMIPDGLLAGQLPHGAESEDGASAPAQAVHHGRRDDS